MKKLIIVFILVVIILVGIWIFLTPETITNYNFLESAFVLVLIVGIGSWGLFRRIKSKRNGEPAEDELSKLILQKSSSLSYYISLYLWLLLSYFSNRLNLETEQLIGYGIIGMAFIFVGSWAYYYARRMKLN